MTQAVITLICIFAVLLFVVLLALVLCVRQQKRNQQSISISDDSYLLIYASQSGTAQAFAQHTVQQIQQAGQTAYLVDIAVLQLAQLAQAKHVIWMVSTYGEGDAPDTAQHFCNWFFDAALELHTQSFAVLSFGDRRYSQFCGFGIRLYEQLLKYNAQPWFDVVTVDQGAEADLQHWNTQLSQQLGQYLNLGGTEKAWHNVALTERTLLNAGSIGHPLYHVIFAQDDAIQWQSGDILELKCRNSHPELLQFQQQFPELSLADLAELQDRNLRHIPDRALHSTVQAWIAAFSRLPIREYSIASIPAQQQLALVVRQEISAQGLGLGSGLLTEKLELGERVDIAIRHNSRFHLQQNDAPAIFIGNGSGIAGLMSHLQQRILEQHTKNWLIYGERQQQFDAIFADQLQHWKQQRNLTDIDLAYSRDTEASYHYVQDVLAARSDQLMDWIEQGAFIYVCGSLKGMAKGVDDQLQRILGAEKLAALKTQGRYLRDVY